MTDPRERPYTLCVRRSCGKSRAEHDNGMCADGRRFRSHVHGSRVSGSFSCDQAVLLGELLPRLLSGADTRQLVRNPDFSGLLRNVAAMRKRAAQQQRVVICGGWFRRDNRGSSHYFAPGAEVSICNRMHATALDPEGEPLEHLRCTSCRLRTNARNESTVMA